MVETKEKKEVVARRDEFLIAEHMRNKQVISFIKKYFKGRISRQGAIKLIELLLNKVSTIKAQDIQKKISGIIHHNKTKFEEIDGTSYLKRDEVDYLFDNVNRILLQLGKEIPIYDETKHSGLKIKNVEDSDVDCYVVDKDTTYEQVRKVLCDNLGEADFFYDFEEPDMPISVPTNKDTLQRCIVQILGNRVKFDYPVEYVYRCSQCENVERKKSYQVTSTNGKFKCPGEVFSEVSGKPGVCKTQLSPDNEISTTKDAFYVDINYEDANIGQQTSGSITFKEFKPGFYEVVLFRVKNPMKTELFQIVDIKPIETVQMQIPEKVAGENYVLTLVKAFDDFIESQTKMRIYGLIPVKIAMIVQALFNILGFQLLANVQIVGDPSTGKSTVFKYWGYLLHNHLQMSSNGLSISVPGLRGTRTTINLLGKEIQIITTGFLGVYRVIHVDEAGENKELVIQMKSFLLETNYSYDKAGSQGVTQRRTAHMNISQNIDQTHLGMYIGQIRKIYKLDQFHMQDVDKPEWNEDWDLFKPLHEYDNPYLRKVIRDVRTNLIKKQVWWIDGYDYALHQRFPFYFYLVNEKKNVELEETVKMNVSRNALSENLDLIRALNSESIGQFFESLKKYMETKTPDRNDFAKVDAILDSYGIQTDSRTKTFFYTFIKIIRVLNQRYESDDSDFDILKYIIENTNIKVDVSTTSVFKVVGHPDIEKAKKEMDEIDDKMGDLKDKFSLGDDEF